MPDYKKLFQDKKQEIENEIIKVCEVLEERIKELCPNNRGEGFVGAHGSNNKYTAIHIYINESLPHEMKLRILFHELGHVKLYEKLGYDEHSRLDSLKNSDWPIQNEFKAYTNELSESMKRCESGDKNFLIHTLEGFENEVNHGVSPYHKDALRKLRAEKIWQNGLDLVK